MSVEGSTTHEIRSTEQARKAKPGRVARTLLSEASMLLHHLNSTSGLTITLHPQGVVHSILCDGILINHAIGDALRGTIGRIYLRRRSGKRVDAIELTTPASSSAFGVSGQMAVWSGTWDGLSYRCLLEVHPTESAWRWRIETKSDERAELDVVLVQDLGLSSRAGVLINEAYTAQYLDQRIETSKAWGPVLMTRQNRAIDGHFPWLAQACVTGGEGCLTDGISFFSPRHRATGMPERLSMRCIGVCAYQGEFACGVLQSVPTEVSPGNQSQWSFGSVFRKDHPSATNVDDLDEVTPLFNWALDQADSSAVETTRIDRHRLERLPRLSGDTLRENELQTEFPGNWRHTERRNGELLSFFRGMDEHVVTRAKEELTERPHGHILRSASELLPGDHDMSSTAWMHGVFASQVTLGNTVFQKLLPVARNPLDVNSRGGLRLLVHLDDGWMQLAVPSAMSMTRGSANWIYRVDKRTLRIRCEAVSTGAAMGFSVDCEGDPVRLMLVSDVLMGTVEYEHEILLDADPASGCLTLRPSPESDFGRHEPDAWFSIGARDPELVEALGGDELLYADGRGRGYPWIAMRTCPLRHFEFSLSGGLHQADQEKPAIDASGQQDGQDAEDSWLDLDSGLSLEHQREEAGCLEETLRWFGHNAAIHLSAPHGLEQYTGGAWGVRDVCQGPVEFLLAKGKRDAVRSILLRVFEEQNPTGDWPQWFMFDGYTGVRQADSHGDVVVWPLKALAAYLHGTGDMELLKSNLGYFGTQKRESILEHVRRAVEHIEGLFIPGTHLMRYGHGDWNDALQPTSASLRERLVSTWTCALLSQALRELGEVLSTRDELSELHERLISLADAIRSDTREHLMPNGLVCGLGYALEDGKGFDPILHPLDKRTGLRYRLLPMTRGILSGLFTTDEARHHLATIREHLLAPDGARLMDRPPEYRGGLEQFFQRSESAASFSREIGLMYVHAHLRYAEALAMLGEADALAQALMCVSPVCLSDRLESAELRQSNAYFSSSDAAVSNREEAKLRYAEVMRGEIGVKGGWRIYSSGPGLYVSTVIRSLLGWREQSDGVLLDPVIPACLNGLRYRFVRDGRPVCVTYHVSERGYGPTGVSINGKTIDPLERSSHPYREGGLLLPVSLLNSPDTLEIEVGL